PARPAQGLARAVTGPRNAGASRPLPAADRPARGLPAVVWWYSWLHSLAQMFHGVAQARFGGFTADAGDVRDVLHGKPLLHAQQEGDPLRFRKRLQRLQQLRPVLAE